MIFVLTQLTALPKPIVAFYGLATKTRLADVLKVARASAQPEETTSDGSVIVRVDQAIFFFDRDMPELKHLRAGSSALRVVLANPGKLLQAKDFDPEVRDLVKERLLNFSQDLDPESITDETYLLPKSKAIINLSSGEERIVGELGTDALAGKTREELNSILDVIAKTQIKRRPPSDQLQKEMTASLQRYERERGFDGSSIRFYDVREWGTARTRLLRLAAIALDSHMERESLRIKAELAEKIREWQLAHPVQFPKTGEPIGEWAVEHMTFHGPRDVERWRRATVIGVTPQFSLAVNFGPGYHTLGIPLWP